MMDNYGNECAETVADLRRELSAVSAERDKLLAAVASVRADCVRDGVPVTAETTDIELILVLGEAIIKEFPRQVAAMLSEQRAKFLDKLSAVETERDALLAWQAAVPVAAIDCVYDDARLESEAPEVQAIWMEIGAWLATLPAPQAKPSPVAAFAELREQFSRYFDYEADEADVTDAAVS